MKYFAYFLYLLTIMVMIGACNFLNYDEIDKYQGALVWNDRYRIRDALVAGYGDIAGNLNQVGGSVRASASDDAEESNDFAGIQKMNDGRWSAINTIDARWSRLYTAIRQMNNFLKHFDLDSLDAHKYNKNYDQIIESFRSYPYQARFLRALFYFRLIKRYGDVPLIKGLLTKQEANTVEPSSYQEITQFIVSECDSIAFRLPVDYHNKPFNETGRATRGAALALKAKVLLYAASPLHNPNNEKDKWVEAAKTANKIIQSGWYTLEPNFSNLFNSTKADGLIFTIRESSSNYYERDNFPIGFQGTAAKGGTNPTQNLVHSFEMQATGLPITDPNSGYDPQHPYNGRDPRLKATVVYNNEKWKGRRVEIWRGGLDGPPISGATETGYYLRKGVVEGVSLLPSRTTTRHHTQIIFRYGGILLDYAEAMNEAYGPYSDPKGFGMTAREAVDLVRDRVQMPAFPMGMSKAAFRKKLHNERRVEMAFENQRFWDIRRWKIGPSTTDIKGVKVTKSPNGSFTYEVETIEHRPWENKMYYYPIPKQELFINDNLKQNDGW